MVACSLVVFVLFLQSVIAVISGGSVGLFLCCAAVCKWRLTRAECDRCSGRRTIYMCKYKRKCTSAPAHQSTSSAAAAAATTSSSYWLCSNHVGRSRWIIEPYRLQYRCALSMTVLADQGCHWHRQHQHGCILFDDLCCVFFPVNRIHEKHNNYGLLNRIKLL